MKWRGREQSRNVEDRRGRPGGRMVAGGGGIGLLLMILIAWMLGINPLPLLMGPGQGAPQQVQQGPAAPGQDDEAREFVAVVLRDTERVWATLFREQLDSEYRVPKLVLYQQMDQTQGCGAARAEFGPFYCPADQTVYVDPNFFYELAQRHRAPGDFAQAYVIAHEVGHHVQLLTGFSQRVDQVRAQGDKIATNRASVRLELQADYLAGVWAHHAHRQYDILEEGDIREAITAANQIGDDTLMREAGQRAIPERFTHGTSQQRVYWFSKGLKSGDFEGCRELFQLPYDQL